LKNAGSYLKQQDFILPFVLLSKLNCEAVMDAKEIKVNLIDQLDKPVRWTQSVQAMIADGASLY